MEFSEAQGKMIQKTTKIKNLVSLSLYKCARNFLLPSSLSLFQSSHGQKSNTYCAAIKYRWMGREKSLILREKYPA